MIVLGIESSCDETSFALVKDGHEILAHKIATQEDLHSLYGGVFPELACRRHIDVLIPLLDDTLKEAGLSLEDVDLISVAQGPGLIGALLIGLSCAKALALALNKPLVGVNHVQAHLYAAMMENTVSLPALGMVLSGGHTQLMLIESPSKMELLSKTKDDALGEAFDKVAVMLDLPYPGGPEIEKLAKQGDPKHFPFQAGQIKDEPLSFSFSGLKTNVLYCSQKVELSPENKAHIAASFQEAAFSDICNKIALALEKYPVSALVLGGGVCANQTLRAKIESQISQRLAIPAYFPSKKLCLDNGAMIAGLGYHLYQSSGAAPFDLPAFARS